jgi:hypothetical protein
MTNPFTPQSPDIQVAVLGEKLMVYEELTKEMLLKLELAVDKISEANQNISKILVRHDERLEQAIQSDVAIIKLLDEMKKQNAASIKEIEEVLKDHDKRIGELSRLRWLVAGAILAAGFIIGEARPLSQFFSPTHYPAPQIPGNTRGR